MNDSTASTRRTVISALHEEALSCAIATLNAITIADYFGNAPTDPEERDSHNHGCWLLSMLRDHLRSIEDRVDALSSAQEG